MNNTKQTNTNTEDENSLLERQDVAQVRNERSCPPSSGSPLDYINSERRNQIYIDLDAKYMIRQTIDGDIVNRTITPFRGVKHLNFLVESFDKDVAENLSQI